MSRPADVRNYINPQPKGKFTAAWQAEFLPDGETYTEDKSGKIIDALVKSVRDGAIVRVRRLFCLAPWTGTPRKRRLAIATRMDAIRDLGGIILEAETQRRSDVRGQCAQMLMGAYEDIATAGRSTSKGKIGRPGREFSKEQWDAIRQIWFSRRYKTRSQAVTAIQALGIRVTSPWLYQRLGSPDKEAKNPLEVIQLIPPIPPGQRRQRVSLVYFIRDGDKVKIGHSVKPTARMSQLRTHSELELLAVCHGGPDRERALHKRFKKYRIKGEWFTLVSAITKYIASMKRAREK